MAGLPVEASAPTQIGKYPNDFAKLRRVCERLATDGELRACYEASSAGYVLPRAMTERGYHCDVIAPSLIPVKPCVPWSSRGTPFRTHRHTANSIRINVPHDISPVISTHVPNSSRWVAKGGAAP